MRKWLAAVKTGKVLPKLEKVVDFRLGPGAAKKHPIHLQGGFFGHSGPATDCTNIYMPGVSRHFKTRMDNEMHLANSTAHEADHIVEINEYFGAEAEDLRARGANLTEAYHDINYSDLTENPALAGAIDNIVKDRRIDAQRAEQLPGVAKFYEESLKPMIKYLRPSTRTMRSDLDKFMEWHLQKALIGETVSKVPDKYQPILEEVVELTCRPGSIHEDPGAVKAIYQIYKDNFDITQKISRLPPMFGTRRHSRKAGPSPNNQGYKNNEVKPRQGRDDKDAKPKNMADDIDPKTGEVKPDEDKGGGKGDKDKDKPKPTEGNKESNPLINPPKNDDEDRTRLYAQAQKEHKIRVLTVDTNYSETMIQYERLLRKEYVGEISSMKRIFRQLDKQSIGSRMDVSGDDLDYESFLQGDLEAKVTGIKGKGKHFVISEKNRQRPAWAVLADISPSTDRSYYNIIDQIRASLLIQGEALGVTDYPFGLFAFSSDIHVVKDFNEAYNENTSNKIVSVQRRSGGTALGRSLMVVGELLARQKERPRGITIITDGQDTCSADEAKNAFNSVFEAKLFPFLIVIGKEFEQYAKYITQDTGDQYYSVIERDKVYQLPGEMFRLFKTYGIA